MCLEKWAIHLAIKKLKYQIIMAILIFDCVSVHAQNLLPNPGFEDENICTELKMACAPAGWELVYTGDSYGYVIDNDAHNGDHMTTILTHNVNKIRPLQYIEAPILCPLIKGKKYQFSMYIRYSHHYLGEIGVYFSGEHICLTPKDSGTYFNGLSYSPQILIENKKERNGLLSKQWLKEEWEYTASGSERFVIIGNFPSLEKPAKSKKREPEVVYFYIDDVSLTPEDLCCTCYYAEYLKEIYTKYKRRHSCNEELPSDSFVKVYDKIDLVPGKPIGLKNINFNTDKSDLLPSSNQMLDSIVSFLRHNENIKLEISGHTDNQAGAEYNMTLSENRANAVMTYLLLHGINGERLSAVGYGNSKPIATNDTEEGRAANRRVEIKILPE